jgi:hypothetical protein
MKSSRFLIAAACAISVSALAVVAPRGPRHVSMARPGPEVAEHRPVRTLRVPIQVANEAVAGTEVRNETAPDAAVEASARR